MGASKELRDPWLVAAWPGMGSVALLAGNYLVQQLQAQRIADFGTDEFYEIQDVDIRNCIVVPAGLPQSQVFEWRDPQGRHDLLLFLGQAQPANGGYTLCRKLTDYAVSRGVRQVFTFAAMATQLDLGMPTKVYAVATDAPTLEMVKGGQMELLTEGKIAGLNGLLLAACLERGLHGICLLGELPFFAVTVPNPRAAKAVLAVFASLTGLGLDLTELDPQIAKIEEDLKRLMEQMNRRAGGQPETP